MSQQIARNEFIHIMKQVSPALAVIALTVILAACSPETAEPENEAPASSSSSSAMSMESSSSSSEMSASSEMSDDDMNETSDAEYEDGTYEAAGSYTSPAGDETVQVSVTLEDDVIVASDFTGNATHQTSMKLQGLFDEGYEAMVVGKSIDEVELDVVNGSSLTPGGFMEALERIKLEARAS